eukprot:COSAG02_NODE_54124_length_298_cov_0.386935_1_plen_99_part_11
MGGGGGGGGGGRETCFKGGWGRGAAPRGGGGGGTIVVRTRLRARRNFDALPVSTQSFTPCPSALCDTIVLLVWFHRVRYSRTPPQDLTPNYLPRREGRE